MHHDTFDVTQAAQAYRRHHADLLAAHPHRSAVPSRVRVRRLAELTFWSLFRGAWSRLSLPPPDWNPTAVDWTRFIPGLPPGLSVSASRFCYFNLGLRQHHCRSDGRSGRTLPLQPQPAIHRLDWRQFGIQHYPCRCDDRRQRLDGHDRGELADQAIWRALSRLLHADCAFSRCSRTARFRRAQEAVTPNELSNALQ